MMRWTVPALALFLAAPAAATDSVLLRGSRRLPSYDYDRNYSSGELGVCQGDCDDDGECLPNLRCFQRLSEDQTVPGCTGTAFKKKDYCYDPAAYPNVLLYIEEEDRNGPLKECEGSCDDDDDCDGDLLCFQRSDSTPVPGCTGDGNPGSDYCYAASAAPSAVPSLSPPPTPYPSSSPSPSSSGSVSASASASASAFPTPTPPLERINGWSSRDGLLAECQGSCDSDGDCEGLLRCFQRSASNKLEAVPGCEGTGDAGSDYCYDQAKNPAYLLNVDSADADGPLNACEGDCGDDTDCAAGLKCYQRGSSTSDTTSVDGAASARAAVPGCEGEGRNDVDYCVHAHLFD